MSMKLIGSNGEILYFQWFILIHFQISTQIPIEIINTFIPHPVFSLSPSQLDRPIGSFSSALCIFPLKTLPARVNSSMMPLE